MTRGFNGGIDFGLMDVNPNNSMYVPARPTNIDDATVAGNIMAIADPTAELKRRQNELIAKSISDIQFSGLEPVLQKKALAQRDEYIAEYKKRLSAKKGLGRLKLDGQDDIDMAQKRKDMMAYVDWGKRSAESMKEVNKTAVTAMEKGYLKPEDYQKWYAGWKKEVEDAPTVGDMPDALTSFTNSGIINALPEEVTPVFKNMDALRASINKPQTGETVKQYDPALTRQSVSTLMRSPEYPLIRKNAIREGVVTEDMTPAEEFEAFVKDAQDHFNPKEQGAGGRTTVFYNGENPSVVNYVMEGNEKVYSFPSKAIDYRKGNESGFLTAVRYNPQTGKATGEFSIDRMIEPEEGFSLFGSSPKKDRFGNDVYEVELDASDLSAISGKKLQLEDGEDVVRALKSQRKRASKAKSGSATSGTSGYLRAFGEDDDINTASLAKGGKYKVGNDIYTWNGKEFE